MGLVVALVLLVAVGFPLAYAVTRQVVLAAVLAPLVTGLQCTAAAVLMVVVGAPDISGVPFALWLVLATVAAWVVAAVLLRREQAPLPALGVLDLAVMYLPLLLPALLVRRPPVQWDARSIWWFHAAWIDAGPTALRDALANPALAFSHPDYPPFSPATVAAAWTVTPGSGLWVAQVVSAVLTLSAVAVLVYAVRILVPSVSPMVARLVALAVGLGTWTVAGYAVTAGYVDHLWAAALAGAVVLLLVGGAVVGPRGEQADDETRRASLVLAVLLMSVAALTKNEGLVAVGIVAVTFTVRARHQLRVAMWVWVPVLLGAAWTFVARAFGASSDLGDSPRIDQLLAGDLEPLERVGPTLSKLAGQVGWVVAAAAIVSAVGALGLRSRRRSLGLAPGGWPWVVLALYAAALVATYVISPYEIVWHLVTSIDRVAALLALVALAVVASWVLVAVAPATDGEEAEGTAAEATDGAGAPRVSRAGSTRGSVADRSS